MSWTAAPLLKYYSDKVNIYCNDNFIPVPSVIACPAPPMILLQPVEEVYECECSPPVVRPIEQPLNPVTALRNFDLRNFAHPPLMPPSLGTYVACSNVPSHPHATAMYTPPPPPPPAPPVTPAHVPAPASDAYSCKSCGK